MKKEVKENFENWYKDLRNDNLCLTDDIDSLMSCYLLNILFGCEIESFYSFDAMYLNKDRNKAKKFIGVDLDIVKGRAFSNHPTYIENKNIISLNKDIKRSNYYDKFAGSTIITIMSLYNVDISDFTREQLELLISIDTAFKQYFFNADLFIYYYKNVLEYPEFIDIVKGKDEDYFYNIMGKYGLWEKIHIKDGQLHTDIKLDKINEIMNSDIALPNKKFECIKTYKNVGLPIWSAKINKYKDKIFSNALTGKDYLSFSV